MIAGDLNLTGDLVVEGVLTGVDRFTLEGNGFQILVQNGGRLDLAGQEKSAWVNWGDPVVGWQVGDRLSVAPTAQGAYDPTSITWQGSWAATVRPASAPDFILVDGRVARPEVANLSQTISLRNLSRVMIHQQAGVQTLRWLALTNCGRADELAYYPIHFHLLGDASRGSIVEGVVVEGGKNHAFVPHSSSGITLRDTVAVNTRGSVYWWDDGHRTADLSFTHCLALGAQVDRTNHATGFLLAGGNGSLVNCAAAGIKGGVPASGGFHWPAFVGSWPSEGLVAHNNAQTGIYVWSNTSKKLVGSNWITFRNVQFGVVFGAYQNPWAISSLLSSENLAGATESADLLLKAVPFSTEPAPRVVGGAVGSVLQGDHNVQTAQNGLAPTLLMDVVLHEFRVRDNVGMWVDLVRCLTHGRDLEAADIVIVQAHSSCRWRGQRRDGTAWQLTPDGTVNQIPPFWSGP